MAIGKKKREQTVVCITLHRKLNFEEHEHLYKYSTSPKICNRYWNGGSNVLNKSVREWIPFHFTECRDKLFSLDDSEKI